MEEPRKVEIHGITRKFDCFFKVDEVDVSHQQRDGKMGRQKRLVFERGDSVAILLLNLDTESVVLVNQFKVPAMVGRRRDDPATADGWITEAIAGMIDEGETPEQAVIRESREETGYLIKNPKLISKFFSSPGGTSERIFLYFAEVRNSDRIGKGGGVDDEDISILHVPLIELFERLEQGSIDDPKLAVGAYWLEDHLKSDAERLMEGLKMTVDDLFQRAASGSINDPKLLTAANWLQSHLGSRGYDTTHSPAQAAARGPAGSGATSGPLPYTTVSFAFKDRPDLIVGYKTGRLDNVRGANIWVNSENTNMLMDRFIGSSISARIRYLGANKDIEGNVIEDRIPEALRRAVGPRGHVTIGTVLMTESGNLKASHRVRRIFHVATVEASPDAALRGRADRLAQCVEAVLDRAELENKKTWKILLRSILTPVLNGLSGFFIGTICRAKAPKFQALDDCDSILIPMFGAGQGNLKVEDVARTVISAAVEHLRNTRLPTVKKIYFLAYQSRDQLACETVFEQYCADQLLVRVRAEEP
jgi:nudix-type nucleoside diphosphatase (YffH/AdpP family)